MQQLTAKQNGRYAGGISSSGGGGSISTRSSDHRRSSTSTSKSASASGAALSVPIGGGAESFEQRMRDMVLGTPSTIAPRRTATASGPVRTLPANVQVIDTLRDYKRVVGDERDKIVAVRFFASYCKVRVRGEAVGWRMVHTMYKHAFVH